MYGVLLDHNFDQEHIITIMYGDIPNNKYNPFSGTIYNHNGNNQRNYQSGLVIDYNSTYNLSPDLYINILLGDADAVTGLTGIVNPKVLNTSNQDYIFLYFVDHGGDGFVLMPNGDILVSTRLVQTIIAMYMEGKYAKMVFYLEACQSGSMWQNLPGGINVYALSSTLSDEASWGTYCPPADDVVDGLHIGTCLGEVWSCAWLEQDDVTDLSTLTLQSQFNYAASITTTSTPMQFGDLIISQDFVGDYISMLPTFSRRRSLRSQSHRAEQWDSRESELLFWKNRALNANDKEAYQKYLELMERNLNVDRYFKQLVQKIMKKEDLLLNQYFEEKNWPCYQALLDKYQSTYGFNEYSIKYGRTLANMCTLYQGDVQDILNAM